MPFATEFSLRRPYEQHNEHEEPDQDVRQMKAGHDKIRRTVRAGAHSEWLAMPFEELYGDKNRTQYDSKANAAQQPRA
jgi:hypothetical protein